VYQIPSQFFIGNLYIYEKLKGAPEKLKISLKIKAYGGMSFKEIKSFNESLL
jgi:hypothetical protein